MSKRFFSLKPFDVDGEEDRYLTACARLRNITPHSLITRLLLTIARDQMVLAILDDGDQPQQRKLHEHRFRGDARSIRLQDEQTDRQRDAARMKDFFAPTKKSPPPPAAICMDCSKLPPVNSTGRCEKCFGEFATRVEAVHRAMRKMR